MGSTRRPSDDDLAIEQGFADAAEQRRFGNKITSRSTLGAQPPRARQVRQQVLDVLADVRRSQLPLEQAARRRGVTPQAVEFWADGAVMQTASDWVVAPADRLYRRMQVIADGQPQVIDVRGSRAASKVGRYNDAVAHFLNNDDDSRLVAMRGTRVAGVELETDPEVIDDLAGRGQVVSDSIYQEVI